MNEIIESGLLLTHKKYKIVWFSIFSGMAGLVLLTFGLHYFDVILPIPVVDPREMDKIILLLIFVFVIVVFFLKRSYLNIHKIIEKARSSKRKVDWSNFSYLSQSDEKQSLLAAAVSTANSIMLVIWFLANLIVITAFVSFIFVPFIKTFLIYSFVGLYSFVINFPSFNLYKKIYSFIFE